MSKYSVADAKNRLPELIDRALKGEDVVITRHGQPVAALNPIESAARRITEADLDWLAEHRVGRRRTAKSAGTLLSELRDEWER
jgi:prevent-host-death family protein